MTDGIARSAAAQRLASMHGAFLRFGVAFVVLFGVFPVVFEMVFPSSVFETLWVEATRAAQLERSFGFSFEMRSIQVAGASRQTLPVITHVVAGGRMAGAGVRTGDVVVCLPRGRLNFWQELMAAEAGYRASLRVSSPDQVGRGCAGARTVECAGNERPKEL